MGRLRGIEYRVSGKHPAPDVGDDILADRIRSTLGPIEKRLDIPRVHVTVFDHKAVLHGAIGNADEERAITEAVTSISGVSAVESRLHIGLSAGSTRPSVGRKPAARAGQHGRTA
ncbi:MAG: BON domain-containing protein [Actinomycetota bacterium]